MDGEGEGGKQLGLLSLPIGAVRMDGCVCRVPAEGVDTALRTSKHASSR